MYSKRSKEVDWPKLINHTKQVTGLSNLELGKILGLALTKQSGSRPVVCQSLYHWLSGKRTPPYYLKFALELIELTYHKEK
jgi:hypothetical protein